jgi:hypothetical protein
VRGHLPGRIATVGLPTVLARTGRTEEALRGYRDVIDYFARNGNWPHLRTTLRNLAALLRGLGDAESAALLDDAADRSPGRPDGPRPAASGPSVGAGAQPGRGAGRRPGGDRPAPASPVSAQGRASMTRLKSPRRAIRSREKPASVSIAVSRCPPASAPSAAPPGWASEPGTQSAVDAV